MRVALYEAGGRLGEESAAWAAAGMVAPWSEAVDASPSIVAMGRRSLELWPEWLKELPVPVFYRDAGTVVVWHSGSVAGGFAAAAGFGAERVLGERLAELEPLVAGFGEGLYLPGEAQVDNREVLAALAFALEEVGVSCHWHTRVEDGAMPEAGVVADCRGMGAKGTIEGLRGMRGEILRLHAPRVELRHMVRLLGESPVYVVPRAEGRLVVGATAYESEDRSPASVSGVMRLMSAAVAVLPGLAEARVMEMTTQVRPVMGDREPVVLVEGRVVRVNGLYRHGFLLSPAVVERVLGALREQG